MSDKYSEFSTKNEESRKRTTPDRILIARLYPYAKPYMRNLLLGVVAILLSSIAALLSPFMHKIAIDQIIQPKNLSGFIWWLPLFIVITLTYYITQYIQLYQMRIVGENVVARMREEMMRKLQEISLRYFSEGEIGRILSRPINDANIVRIFIRMGLTTIITDTSSIIGSLIIIFFLNVKLALLAVAILPVATLIAWFLGLFSRKIQRKVLVSISGLTSKMQESLSGMKVIKGFVREDETKKEFDLVQEGVVRNNITATTISTSYQPIVITMRVIGTTLLLWYGALMAMSTPPAITLGILVAFIEYQFAFFLPLMDLITAFDQYQSAMAAIERMIDVIDTTIEVKDPPIEKAISIKTIDNVKFENVTFGYDPKIPVIKNISYTLTSNKKLAIVGPTGAGKSTIINLLSRFYDPLNGTIIVNSYDIKEIKISSLREHMSIVLQDSFLFPMSVKDNIRFGKSEASDEQVMEAAKIVGAHEFIMKLPNGYEYIIQENSSNISIGQRQLISFARTLLMNPKLLILDEATSSIDPYTELVLQNALKNLLNNRMAIIIAHRLSTIRLCDEIIVIDHGEIVEKGTHLDLMEKGGMYSSFYRMQFREEEGLDLKIPLKIS